MNIKEHIEKLFDDDADESRSAKEPKELAAISIGERIRMEALENQSKSDSGIDRREFTRAEVLEKKLELRFSNSTQFARQYIENISIGGLFVRTDQKPDMGSMVPIEFTIPGQNNQPGRTFQLVGQVCRVTDSGIGLQFANLAPEMRHELEDYVRSVLPSGAPLSSKAKASTLEALQKRRAESVLRSVKRRKQALQWSFIALLFFLNGFLVKEKIVIVGMNRVISEQSLQVNGKKIPLNSITSIKRDKNGQFILHLSNKTDVSVTDRELEQQAPYHMRQSLEVLRSVQPVKQPRRSKNTRGLVTRARQ